MTGPSSFFGSRGVPGPYNPISPFGARSFLSDDNSSVMNNENGKAVGAGYRPINIRGAVVTSMILQAVGTFIIASGQQLPLIGMAAVVALVDAYTRPLLSNLFKDTTIPNRITRLIAVPLLVGSCAHLFGVGFNIIHTIAINTVASFIISYFNLHKNDFASFWFVVR